jgi:hypothetical protein
MEGDQLRVILGKEPRHAELEEETKGGSVSATGNGDAFGASAPDSEQGTNGQPSADSTPTDSDSTGERQDDDSPGS